MFQHSYQPRNFTHNLASIAYGKLGGSSNDDRLFEMLCNCTLSRDKRAPVEVTAEQLEECNQRKDIQLLCRQRSRASEFRARERIRQQIRSIVKSWTRLKVEVLREQYFTEADRRRGLGLPTDDLGRAVTIVQSPETRIGHFLDLQESEQRGYSSAFGQLLHAFLQKRASPLSEDITVTKSQSSTPDPKTAMDISIEKIEAAVSICFLCRESFANRGSLTRHHKRKHLTISFEVPFPCPECQRLNMPSHVIDSPSIWSGHVETYHGWANAPNLPAVRGVLHTAPAPESRVYCLICSKTYQPGKGFSRHLQKHKSDGVFEKKFQCGECKQQGQFTAVEGFSAWIAHSAQVHGGCPKSGALDVTSKGEHSEIGSLKRTRDDECEDDSDVLTTGRNVKMKTEHHGGSRMVSQVADSIPIDPALFNS
jgi:hypothetical protein